MQRKDLGSLEQQVHERILDLRENTEHDRIFAMTTLRISQSLDVDEILETTVNEVRQFLATERVIVYRFEPDGSGVVVVESVDESCFSMLGRTIHDPCLSQDYLDAYSNDRVQSTEDIYASNLSSCHIELLAHFGIRANLVVPIMQVPGLTLEQGKCVKSSKVWGLLATQQCSGPREWKPSEIEFLQKLAIYVELAIHHAELLDIALRGHLRTYYSRRESTIRKINAIPL